MLIVTACDIQMRLGLGYLFKQVILAPVLGRVSAGRGAADTHRTVVDALEAAAAQLGDGIAPAATTRVTELVERGASVSVLATDGST